jgi:hypothetical protein
MLEERWERERGESRTRPLSACQVVINIACSHLRLALSASLSLPRHSSLLQQHSGPESSITEFGTPIAANSLNTAISFTIAARSRSSLGLPTACRSTRQSYYCELTTLYRLARGYWTCASQNIPAFSRFSSSFQQGRQVHRANSHPSIHGPGLT